MRSAYFFLLPKMKSSQILGRILVVDDQPEVMAIFSRILENQGFEVSTATSSNKACELLETNEFDLVILDWFLGPESSISHKQVTGHAVLAFCHKIPSAPPVIITSGKPLDDSIAVMLRECDSFLEKPFSMPLLLSKVSSKARLKGAA
jgi:DNA-binding response OmpR family regulator